MIIIAYQVKVITETYADELEREVNDALNSAELEGLALVDVKYSTGAVVENDSAFSLHSALIIFNNK